MEYNVDYFLAKFSNTREDKWCTGSFRDGDKACAFGWCGCGYGVLGNNREATQLMCLLNGGVASINDGDHPQYQQPTPKQRILAALYDIKFKEVNRLISNIEEKELSTTNKEKQNELSTY